MHAHVVDGGDVREEGEPWLPHSEPVACDAQPDARRDDPRRLADNQPARRHQACVA